jgi:hypothetical protein
LTYTISIMMVLRLLNRLLKIDLKLKFSHCWSHDYLILSILKFTDLILAILIIYGISWSAAYSAALLTKIFYLSHFLQIYILVSSFLTPSTFFFSISRAVRSTIQFHCISPKSWIIVIFNNSFILFSPSLGTS